jgi:NAD+ diphosphatase
MARRFQPALSPPERSAEPAYWFAVRGRKVLVVESAGSVGIPRLASLHTVGLEVEASHYLGAFGEIACYAAHVVEEVEAPEGMSFLELRPALLGVEEELAGVVGLAYQIVDWDRTHRFCGRCGTPTEDAPGERAKRCPSCDLHAWPRVSPAVIVRVTRGDEILLARGRRFVEPIYSVLAGFVDPGESLEEAAVREIREEVGVEIADVRYFGSQPWPFPHSLMVGFTARWAGGEIRIEEEEIVDAAWFRADALPPVPPGLSIARKLIDDFVARTSGSSPGA